MKNNYPSAKIMKINTFFISIFIGLLSISAYGDVRYKNRDIDPRSTLEVMGVGSLFEERVIFIQVKSVNLIDAETTKREYVSELPLIVKESAFIRSFNSNSPKIDASVKNFGDLSNKENTFVWSLSVGEVLDEIDEISLNKPDAYSKYVFSGQWAWYVTPECFNNYSFSDKGEFVSAHGNGLNIGTYRVVKTLSDYEFILSVEVEEVVHGDVSCGDNWFQNIGRGSALLRVIVKKNKEGLHIYNMEDNSKTLGPFVKIH